MRRLALAVVLLVGVSSAAWSQISDDVVRIGVLTDESGPYADSAGPGSVTAARLAVEDFGATVRGKTIEIVHADTQNKPDVASGVARRWFDSEGVDAVVDLPVTPIALAVQDLAKQKDRTVMITASAASEFTSKFCSPVSTHWADDTHALAAGTAQAVIEGGGKSWFFITVDMAFGLASVGNDLVNLLKQAGEFGLGRDAGQTLAGFLVYIQDVQALGLPATQGLTFTAGYYWNQNDAARAFARRFFAQQHAMPSKNHALIYTAVLQYLRAVDAAGTDEAVAVNRAMRGQKFDFFGKPAAIRLDGRVLYDETLWRVKKPGESTEPWDDYALVRTVPAATAFLPASSACGG